jgi:hypothetical protein
MPGVRGIGAVIGIGCVACQLGLFGIGAGGTLVRANPTRCGTALFIWALIRVAGLRIPDD